MFGKGGNVKKWLWAVILVLLTFIWILKEGYVQSAVTLFIEALPNTSEWTVTNVATATNVYATKSASAADKWIATDVSGGGTQNGFIAVRVNSVEKWRLYFPANGSVGQKVFISGAFNQKVEVYTEMTTSGTCTANIRGISQ